MKVKYLIFSVFLFASCNLPDEIIQMASRYSGSLAFFENAQTNFRKINSDCEYKADCFQRNSEKHLKEELCPNYERFNFVSESECNRAGKEVINLVSGKTELAVPVRNTAQDAHNNRMYELEKERLSQSERQRQDELQRQAEQQRQDELQRQAEQQRQKEQDLMNDYYNYCRDVKDKCLSTCPYEKEKQNLCLKSDCYILYSRCKKTFKGCKDIIEIGDDYGRCMHKIGIEYGFWTG